MDLPDRDRLRDFGWHFGLRSERYEQDLRFAHPERRSELHLLNDFDLLRRADFLAGMVGLI